MGGWVCRWVLWRGGGRGVPPAPIPWPARAAQRRLPLGLVRVPLPRLLGAAGEVSAVGRGKSRRSRVACAADHSQRFMKAVCSLQV